ncbi:hypothetical protein EWM64_g9171 [Hericium alpestre]|uniref:Uncharacterized protein n=1 Tax=Hericium alpestre TaxID=135208 RepID=A0A4Y9ZJF2_9AGAM|nr:hypothetical protein EWM64_g9171 [Hericium alpestre]
MLLLCHRLYHVLILKSSLSGPDVSFMRVALRPASLVLGTVRFGILRHQFRSPYTPQPSAPAGNQSGIAAFLAELQASFVAQHTTQAGPSQVLHAQGPGEVLTFSVDIFDFDQTLILSEVEIPQGQDETLLAMPTGEIEVIQGTFQEIAFDEGAVDEADLDSDESSDGSSDGGDTEEMDWEAA